MDEVSGQGGLESEGGSRGSGVRGSQGGGSGQDLRGVWPQRSQGNGSCGAEVWGQGLSGSGGGGLRMGLGATITRT